MNFAIPAIFARIGITFLHLIRTWKASRYIEFCKDNLNTYSIDLAHLLLSYASEIDTIDEIRKEDAPDQNLL
jgi:hypothetical protein